MRGTLELQFEYLLQDTKLNLAGSLQLLNHGAVFDFPLYERLVLRNANNFEILELRDYHHIGPLTAEGHGVEVGRPGSGVRSGLQLVEDAAEGLLVDLGFGVEDAGHVPDQVEPHSLQLLGWHGRWGLQ